MQIHSTELIYLLLCLKFIESTMQNFLENLAKTHYENFPVGSWLIPKQYRETIHLIYAFVRVADDLADEGTMNSAARITRIDEWQQRLHDAVKGNSSDEFFIKLADAIQKNNLSLKLFDDLLIAFRRDAANPLYNTFDEVLEYCTYSANPIGRLLLQIFECSDDETERLSDKICTALQLTNFWQDISVDTRRNRFYIPQADLQDFGLQISDLRSYENEKIFRELMKMQIERTRKLFEEGKPLFGLVAKNFRFELNMIWNGGMRILEKIEAMNFDTRFVRPKLTVLDKALIFSRAFLAGRHFTK